MNKSSIFKGVVIGGILCFQTLAAPPQWHSLGLDSHAVNCITVDHMGNVIAGVDIGLYLLCYFSDRWYEMFDVFTTNEVTVHDVMIPSRSRLIAAVCGSGDVSDGLYAGDQSLLGPPFYCMGLVDSILTPTACATAKNGNVVYVGNGTKIRYSTRDSSGNYSSLQPIHIPANSFGVEMPYCAALQIYSRDTCLFAGGYDRSSTEPGPSYLLWGQGDSLLQCTQLNISAMTEGIVDWGGVKLFVGTIDSGIYWHSSEMSMVVQKYAESPNGEAVNDIIILPTMIENGHVCVAVASGVYTLSGNAWIELGDIPAEPTCLALKQNNSRSVYTIHAGTDKGVYVFDSLTVAVTGKAKTVPEKNISIHHNTNGTITISFSLLKSDRVTIDILDVSGRVIATPYRASCSPGVHTLTRPTANLLGQRASNGVYIVQIKTKENVYAEKYIFTR